MVPVQAVSLIIWIGLSLLTAYFLHKKFGLFQKPRGALVLLTAFLVFTVLHNLVYGLFKPYFDARGADEAVFFILSFIALGAIPFLLLIQIFQRVRGPGGDKS